MEQQIEYGIEWTQSANHDLKQAFDYISEAESPTRANYVVSGLIKAVETAVIFPTKHRVEPLLNRRDVRFAVKWHYKILFQVKTNTILILRIFHTAQNPNKLIE